MICTNYDALDPGNIMTHIEAPTTCGFREDFAIVKICIRDNFTFNVGHVKVCKRHNPKT